MVLEISNLKYIAAIGKCQIKFEFLNISEKILSVTKRK